MIPAAAFCAELRRRGVGLVSGVPCGYLRGPLRLLAQEPVGYVAAANEGAALAIAAGAELAGVRAAVLIQNSGFGNLVNPLSTLAQTYRIPVLVFMTMRGWPDPDGDEPQHAVVGRSTQPILTELGVPFWTLGDQPDDLVRVLDEVDAARRNGEPAFVLVPRGAIGGTDQPAGNGTEPVFGRREAIAALLPSLKESLVFATTGRIHRELFGARDQPGTFYMAGSMGHAVALGLGAAAARPDRRVVVLDGDGAVVMHLGTLASVGQVAPPNLVHVVLDNGEYESTGGQASPAGHLDWRELAHAVGYRSAAVCDTASMLAHTMTAIGREQGPHLVVARIQPGGGRLPARPTDVHRPEELFRRFRAAASSSCPAE